MTNKKEMTKENNNVVNFDMQAYKLELSILEKQAQTYKQLMEICSLVGSETLLTLEQLEAEILKDSTFTNIEKVAELKKIDYSFYKANINNVNVLFYDNEYNVTEVKKEALKQKYTLYLNDEQIAIKAKLLKVCDVLNSINVNYTNALYKSPVTNKFEVKNDLLFQVSNTLKR